MRIVSDKAPTYARCDVGAKVVFLRNVLDVMVYGDLPRWNTGEITAVSLEGTFERKYLAMMMVVEVLTSSNVYRIFRITLWEPGITNTTLHLGDQTSRPVIILLEQSTASTANERLVSATDNNPDNPERGGINNLDMQAQGKTVDEELNTAGKYFV